MQTLDTPKCSLLPNALVLPHADSSDALLPALRDFDHVEFFDCLPLAFRAVQAKRAGLAFQTTTFAFFDDSNLPLHSPSITSSLDLLPFYMQKYVHTSLTHSFLTSPTNAIADDSPTVSICIPHYNLGDYLPAALDSLANQTYPHLDVIVIDDGSTDPHSLSIFDQMTKRFSAFRFLRQPNQGIGATRNRGLQQARGEYFIPFDADNVAHPDMVWRFVTAMQCQPQTAALTCYYHAFDTDDNLRNGKFLYAVRPTGGPYVLAATQNVYGDACAIFRRSTLLDCGGFSTDRGTSFEDWELFVKMVGRGLRVDVVPEVLFWYRHRENGFSRVTDGYANHQRVLRAFAYATHLPAHEREWMAQAIAALEHRRNVQRSRSLRQRMWAWLRGQE